MDPLMPQRAMFLCIRKPQLTSPSLSVVYVGEFMRESGK